MNEQPRHCPQVVRIVLLRVSIDNGSEEFKIIKDLREDIDQGSHLVDLLTKTLDDHILALELVGSTRAIAVWLVDTHAACLVHHILERIIRSLGQEDIVVQEFWSDLSQQGHQESLDGGFSEVYVVHTARFLEAE